MRRRSMAGRGRSPTPPAEPAPPVAVMTAAGSGWRTAGGTISLRRPCVMGILNVTPDSFSDGGRFAVRDEALRQAERMKEEGADLIDVGGESTRPGADEVSVDEEVSRVIPVIEALRGLRPLSIDTRKAAVAEAALRAGATVVNDVSGLADPGMADVVARHRAGVVIMHMRGVPATMRDHTGYADLVREVREFLAARLEGAIAAGIEREHIVLDPGVGFAKTAEQSIRILGELPAIVSLGQPVLIGPSRKSFLATMGGGAALEERLPGTIGACVAALSLGARIFRVHDVAEVRRALDVAEAILHRSNSNQRG